MKGVCMNHLIQSKAFVIWRIVYASLLLLISLPFICVPGDEIGSEPGYWYLVYGILPSVIILLLIKMRSKHALSLAVAHDFLVLVGFIYYLAILRGNYLGLFFMLPLAAFVLEGFVLVIVWCRHKR